MMNVSIETARRMIRKTLNDMGQEGDITGLFLSLGNYVNDITQMSSVSFVDRWIVEVNGKYFGTYDTIWKSFID